MMYFLIIFCLQLWTLNGYEAADKPPHIVFIYADDLGWNDVSFHGSREIPTNNLDALAMSGILLNNYYGQWLCTPSRGSLLTGLYPVRLGLQHSVITVGEASGLPLQYVTLPQRLKNLGYATHMIGKWHLGYMKKEYTPTYRGFDSFFGYYNGNIDYYDFVVSDYTYTNHTPMYIGIDLQKGTDVIRNFRGRYATEVFTEKAEEIIMQHNTSLPLFLYLSHLAVHRGNYYMPLQAPPKYVSRVKYIKDLKRRIHAGSVLALDDSVGLVFKALHDRDMLQNCILIFASDNGGETNRRISGVSSNYPLRGKKETMWEGGNRLPALIWSPLFKLQNPRVSRQLMHVTDWLPTLYKAAGGNPKDLGDIDGLDMWETLINDLPSPRSQFLYNIDPIIGVSAFRLGDMKVINGTTGYNSWYNPPEDNNFDMNQIMEHSFHEKNCLVRDILMQSPCWMSVNMEKWRKEASVVCTQPPPANGGGCNPGKKPCLFNITDDPCEYNDLAKVYPEVLSSLMERIHDYEMIAVTPQSKPSDPRGNPECYDYAYVPWMDPEYHDDYTACDVYVSKI